MSWYRELAGEQIFRCAECGKRKRVKYVPTSNLCRSCAARKAAETRRSVPNIPVTLTESLVDTKVVEKRLSKKATAEIPRTRAEVVVPIVHILQVSFFWVSGYFVATILFGEPFSGAWWLFLLGWCVGAPYIVLLIIDKILEKPIRERREKIRNRVLELAEDRRKKLEEEQQFYASPEWAQIRKQVIEGEGRVCAECGKRIVNENDVTVDHKYPRSRYPNLALKRENLRVLCRRCNSRKRDKEWVEV